MINEQAQKTYERVVIGGLLLIVFGVPVSQIVIELVHGTPVRCTDLFHSIPTTAHLRDYERSLEEQWWGNRIVRPVTERALFASIGRTNRKVLVGRDGWLFYRPGVEYLVDSRLPSGDRGNNQTMFAEPTAALDAVVRAIVRFDRRLRDRGLTLVVVPVPGKACIYPDRLTGRAAERWSQVRSPTEKLLDILQQCGVLTVDLVAAMREQRRALERAKSTQLLYLRRDTHWSPTGAAVAAVAVARQLVQCGM